SFCVSEPQPGTGRTRCSFCRSESAAGQTQAESCHVRRHGTNPPSSQAAVNFAVTKFLIDECLSSELALMARERGHHEASPVVWIGKSGWKDWQLKQVLLDDDWVLVTWNCNDFRGAQDAPGSKGVFADVPLHAGLICIDGPTG